MIAGAAATGPRMQAGGGRTVEFTLLVRAYCNLCDEMRTALAPFAAARNATIRLIDVDAEPALEAAWGDLVPVLFIGEPAPGAELCHYHLDRARVEAALREYAAEVPSQPKMR